MKKYFLVFLFLLGCQTQTYYTNLPDALRGPSAQMQGLSLVASVSASTPYVNKIESDQDFESISVESKGLVSSGKATKFVIDNRDPQNAKIYYMNSNFKDGANTPEYVQFHMYFTQRFLNWTGKPEQFNAITYFVNGIDKKKFIAGTIQSYLIDQNNVLKPIYGVQFYPQDLINEETILHAMKVVKNSVSLSNPLSFIAYGSQQTVNHVREDLLHLEIADYSISQLLASQSSISMNEGEAWGYLRWQPKANQNLTYLEIPVFNEIPLDLSVVAGVVTTQVQNPGSHINLKSKERGTPNVIVLNKDLIGQLELLKDQPVHLKVTFNSYSVEKIEGANGKTADQIVNEKNQQKLGTEWFRLKKIVPRDAVWFDNMCPASEANCLNESSNYGGKSAKLGFLSHKNVLGEKGTFSTKFKIPYRLTPYGFAIPLQYYVNFVKNNPELDKVLTQFIQKEKAGLFSPTERAEQVDHIQALFHHGKIPAADFQKEIGLVKKMIADIQTKYGVTLKKFKVRSSANVEDMPGFDGAGLHSSFTAKVKDLETDYLNCEEVADTEGESEGGEVGTKTDMKPGNMACAIKGVYASLWNLRAIEERSYRRIDHETAGMALAMHVNYNFQKDKGLVETANSVILTRVLNTEAVYGYSLNIQQGENLVTNPEPGTTSEYTLATFLDQKEVPQFTILQKAIPVKGQPELPSFVLDPVRMNLSVDIARHLEMRYCKANKSYYKSDCYYIYSDAKKPKSLDMEIKYLGTDQLMVKQMREFGGH